MIKNVDRWIRFLVSLLLIRGGTPGNVFAAGDELTEGASTPPGCSISILRSDNAGKTWAWDKKAIDLSTLRQVWGQYDIEANGEDDIIPPLIQKSKYVYRQGHRLSHSLDGGQTWEKMAFPVSEEGNSPNPSSILWHIEAQAAHPEHVYASWPYGVYVSTNAGNTGSAITKGHTSCVGPVILGGREGQGFYFSANVVYSFENFGAQVKTISDTTLTCPAENTRRAFTDPHNPNRIFVEIRDCPDV